MGRRVYDMTAWTSVSTISALQSCSIKTPTKPKLNDFSPIDPYTPLFLFDTPCVPSTARTVQLPARPRDHQPSHLRTRMDDGRRLFHLPRLLRSGQFDHDRRVGEGSGGYYGQEGEDQGDQVSLRESRVGSGASSCLPVF